MSPSWISTCPPAAVISSAVWCTAGPGRSLSTTRAPAAASASASARPRPLPAPVTIAVLPSRVRSSVMTWIIPWSVAGPAEHPAVGDELTAGGVGGVVRGQERDEPGDLDRLGHPGDRQRLEERLPVDDV